MFVLVQRMIFLTVPLTKDLCRRMSAKGLKWVAMRILFLWRWELVIVTHDVWNKWPESILYTRHKASEVLNIYVMRVWPENSPLPCSLVSLWRFLFLISIQN